MSEDRILHALRALAENDSGLEACPGTEELLLRKFRRRRFKMRRRRVVIGLVAAGLAAMAFVATNRPALQRQAAVVPPAAAIATTAAASPVAVIAPVPTARRTVRKPVAAERGTPREVFTEFFPMMDAAPAFDRGQLLRVQLPAAAMRSVGLPVREEHLADPVQADVLVGEEGMPRAIRFVRFETQ